MAVKKQEGQTHSQNGSSLFSRQISDITILSFTVLYEKVSILQRTLPSVTTAVKDFFLHHPPHC